MNAPGALGWVALAAVLVTAGAWLWDTGCDLIRRADASLDDPTDVYDDDVYDQELDVEPFLSWEKQFEVTA